MMKNFHYCDKKFSQVKKLPYKVCISLRQNSLNKPN